MDSLMSSRDHSSVTSRGGCSLAYRVRGHGPPVLFIQGINTHGDGWKLQVEGLCDRFTCVTFDNRGTGGSERGSDPITIEAMALDAAAVMDAAGWTSAHVVGHSLGGAIGLQLALSARPRVRSLTLLCSFANGRAVGPLSWRLIWAGMRMKLGTRRMKRRAFLDLVVPRGSHPDRDALAGDLAPLFGHDLAVQLPVAREQMNAMRAFNVSSRLHELAGLPILTANAEHDLIAPPSLGRAITAAIPDATYVDLEGASHGVILTEPHRINTLLSKYLDDFETRWHLRREGAS